MKKVLALFVSVIVSASATAADNQSYFGGAYHSGVYEEQYLSDANPASLKLKYGQYLSPNLAIEGHLLFGISDDSINVNGIDVDIELSQALSIFLKGDINLTATTNLYGLIGFSRGELEASVPEFDVSVTEKDSDLSYGVGIESEISPNLLISAEYISYLSEDTYDYSGFNFGISKKF